MGLKGTLEKLLTRRNMIILLLVGIVLMLMPELFFKDEGLQTKTVAEAEKLDVVKLEKTLSKIKGVKNVDIFVSYSDNGSTDYAYDIISEDGKQELEIKMSDEAPIVNHTKNPKVEGILVVLTGNNLSEFDFRSMLKAATGVPSHRIYVKISEGD